MGKNEILILGGAGFGGSALARRLVDKGHDVTILDIVSPRHANLVRDLYEQELISYNWKSIIDLVPEDVDGFDIIYDFAAQADTPLAFSSPTHTVFNNIFGMYRIMECLKSQPPSKFIYTGSGTTFGEGQILPIAENAPQCAANPYSASKHCAEIVTLAYHRSHDIPVTIIRNGIVYGEHMRREIVIARFIINALLGKPLVVEGGDQSRDLNYVSNTLDAFELLVEADSQTINGEIFHCASGVETAINKLAKLVIELTNSESSITRASYRKGEENVRQCLDYSKAERVINYSPKISLKEGLQRTIRWFAAELETSGLTEKAISLTDLN
ncbi:MAG: NAD-dependent epimerase/dehydratase family protein [Promethearchaeota archaeon]|jgi:UDP-glucose 4-epimerase